MREAAKMTAPLRGTAQEIRADGVVIVRDRSALPVQEISHDSEGITKQVVLSFHDTRGYLTQVSVATYQPGSWFKSHVHGDMDELFEIVTGEVTFTFGSDGEELTLGAGGYVNFPAGVCHGATSMDGAIVQTTGVRMRVNDNDADEGKGKNIPTA
jgi:mannose-6-phosphate isomerase-like protein (cupin superfamily)